MKTIGWSDGICMAPAFSLKGREMMISKCINPMCRAQFKEFGQGDIYLLERHAMHTVEYFWLCADCRKNWTLTYSKPGVPGVVAKSEQDYLPPPTIDADMRLAFGHRADSELEVENRAAA